MFCFPFLYSQSPLKSKALEDASVEDLQIILQTENIRLTFLVRDSLGNFVRDLSASDFVLLENGQPREIALLKEEEIPISAVVMVDTSWSIGYFLGNAVRTAVDFFKGLQREHSAFVLFSESPRVVLSWDDPAEDLTEYLRAVEPNGKTALYDSLIWAAENMFRNRPGKKLIVLLTDGIDTKSEASFKDMMRVTRAQGVTLYPIIYTNEYIQHYREGLRISRPAPRVSRDFHNLVLLQNQFVDQTLRYGGRTIFSNAFSDLKKIYTDIIQEMKSQYLMVYHSSLGDKDQRRDVKVYTKKVPGKIFINIGQ